MNIRFELRLRNDTTDKLYGEIRDFLAANANKRVTYSFFDGVYSVYFEDRADFERAATKFSVLIAHTRELF